MYANTKKELFLCQRPFDAPKLTPDEMLSKMCSYIKNNVNVKDYDYDETDLENDDTDRLIGAIAGLLREFIADEADGGSTEIGEILLQDLDVDGAQLVGFANQDDYVKIVTLSNGFTYLRILSNLGNGSFASVYVALYIGVDDKIHGFIPTYGNNVFADTHVQLGAASRNDDDAWDELLEEYDVDYNKNDPFAYGKACFETYAKKYGVEGTANDANYRQGEYVETMLELNEAYCEKDISSNVILI